MKRILTTESGRMLQVPDLKLYVSDQDHLYFDATFLIQKRGKPKLHDTDDFFVQCRDWCTSVERTYKIPFQELNVKDDDTGHMMVYERLLPIFLSYLDDDYKLFILDAINELYQRGVVVTDEHMETMKRKRRIKMRGSNFKEPKMVLVFNGARVLVGCFRSLHSAAQYGDKNLQAISAVCSGRSVSTAGYYFRHLDMKIIDNFGYLDNIDLVEYDKRCGKKRRYHSVKDMAKMRHGTEIKRFTIPTKDEGSGSHE